MIDLAANFEAVQARIDAACDASGRPRGDVALLAVSKGHPGSLVRHAFALGHIAFGENRVQELVAKSDELKALAELRWHLIGSLQTNKVRDLLKVPGLELVHVLDRRKLADELQRHLSRAGRSLAVLLQVNATHEEQKHGCPVEGAAELLAHVQGECPALEVRGLMAMGPLAGEPLPVFERVAALREELRTGSGLPLPALSLGMSDDLEDAVAAGSTMVRIGTALFGPRG